MSSASGVARFLVVTLGITGLYLGLNAFWLTLAPSVYRLTDARVEEDWQREAGEVAQVSRRADNRLPASSRLDAYRLGFQVGYCSNVLGSVALSSPEVQARFKAVLEPRLASAQELARTLGVGDVTLLKVTNVDEFGHVPDRLDADELGLANRLEAVTSRRHRHLLLLGMQVGAGASLTQVTGGNVHDQLRPLAGRHATLAGVPAQAWEPVTVAPAGATADERLAAYQKALSDLDAAVGALEPLR
jgi:hypothetical protein